MKKQFVAIVFQAKENYVGYEDLRRDDRVIFLDEPRKNLKNPFWRFVYKLYCSPKVTRILRLPFREKLWGRSLDSIAWEEDTEYYVFFTSFTPATEASYLLDMKNKHPIKYITFFNDPVAVRCSDAARRKLNLIEGAKVDYVFTSEPKNMVKYPHMLYHPSMYSMSSDNDPDAIEWDLYLAATGSSDRLKIFLDVFAASKTIRGGGTQQIPLGGREKRGSKVSKRNYLYEKCLSLP